MTIPLERKASIDRETVLRRLRTVGPEAKEELHHSALKRASVLIPLVFPNNDPSGTPMVLLTRRCSNLRSHGGEVCFPGGKQDEEDQGNDVTTALRETKEEIGLDSTDITAICRLKTLESLHHLCVTPIVGLVHEDAIARAHPSRLQVNPTEVESAFWCPLSFFLAKPAEEYPIEWSGSVFQMRRYTYLYPETGVTYSITGLTAHWAHEVATLALMLPVSPSASHVATSISSEPSKQEESSSSVHSTSPSLSQTDTAFTATSSPLPSKSGYLWKQEFSTATNQPYWSRRYFVCDGTILHSYDHDQQAQRSLQRATKKHRLMTM